ncbi:MAG TPA: DUF1648 domain-containing protein [Cellulomonas sp.]
MSRRTPAPHRPSSTLLGLVLPLVLLGAATALVLSWRADLPDRIATHFSSGGADGFGSWQAFLVGMVATFGAMCAGLWALAFWTGRDGSTRRIAVGTSVGLAWLCASMVVGVAWLHRGLTDPADVGDIDPVITVGVVGGLLLGALVAWAVPGDRHQPADPAAPIEGARLDLAPGERAVWTRRVGSRAAVLAGGGSTVLVLGLAVGLQMPWMVAVAVLLGATMAALIVFVVTVDARGMQVRSVAGWPRFAVPVDEVVRVRTIEVRPVRDFGGWGYRVGIEGRVGVISRGGPAIEVERAGGRRFVVTVDDAATGAALLTTLADRARGDGAARREQTASR